MFFKKNDPNNTCDNYKKKHEEDLVRIQCLKEVISDIQGKNIRLVRENRALNKQIEQIKNSMEEEQGVFSYAQPENLSFGNYKTVYVRRPASDGSQENPEVVFEQEKTAERKIHSIYEEILRREAKQYIENMPFSKFVQSIQETVIGQNMEILLAMVYNYISCIAEGKKPPKNNAILTGPSGSGKSETYRALANHFSKYMPSLVVHQVDLTHVTTEGFKGNDTSFIVSSLIKNGTGGYGIIFMDEIDKRMMPQMTNSNENVGRDVQSQMLTLIEGSIEDYSFKGGASETIDSGLTMFIGCGSFDYVREAKREKANSTMGFLGQEKIDHFENITREDILSIGGTYEFIGRFAIVLNYNRLNEESVRQIISKMKLQIEDALGMTINLSEEFVQELLKSANSEFGCRLLYSMIYEKAISGYIKMLKEKKETILQQEPDL